MAIRGVLLDLEGVLYQDGLAIPGAPEAVAALDAQGLALRFLTNTTTRPRRAIVERMQALGFTVELEQVFTPARAARALLEREGLKRLHLAAAPSLAEDFTGFDIVADPRDPAEAIVLGDLHTGFTWDYLDDLFRLTLNGARLVALHKNRYCRRGADIALDLGPFVAALEYAADARALIVGKPAEAFFLGAVDDMGLSAQEVVMVGDDIESDVGGALDAGLKAVQVKTGKYRREDDAHPRITASGRVASIADLPAWIAGS